MNNILLIKIIITQITINLNYVIIYCEHKSINYIKIIENMISDQL